MNRRRFLAGVVCVLLLASVPLPVAAHLNHVTAGAQQSPDGTLVVESVFTSSGRYLTVQRDDGGEPGAVIGVTRVRTQTYLVDVRVGIDDEAWDEWETQPVHLVLRVDDGDGEFDPEDDTPAQSFGSAATERLTVGDGPRAVVTAGETLTPDRRGTITVRRAVSDESGHLVVRERATDRTLGTTPIDAGTHESVTLTVNATARTDARVLLATDASGESPLRVGEDAIGTNVTVAAPSDTGTTTATPELVTTPNETATAGATASDTTSADQPGFGAVVTITLAFAAAVALAARR
ncbi:hypothetical protein BRC71_08810 [Halobacteriales archaeon QH_7_65_31]|nr:MAG: hypothetical protein BRC71_08810 [Halobacteriales archaeon QH_7_65_31]